MLKDLVIIALSCTVFVLGYNYWKLYKYYKFIYLWIHYGNDRVNLGRSS
jgi:hypothetical protein